MNTIQMNKLSYLHNDVDVIFCKTDFLLGEFDRIRKLNHDVILITGNSDYFINDSIYSLLPSNVRKWFAQNSLIKSDRVICIPIGIENTIPSKRIGHGIVNTIEQNGQNYNSFIEELVLISPREIEPTKFIYANFRLSTFADFHISRSVIKEYSQKVNYIDWEDPNLSSEEYLNRILEFEAVLCPQGNGPGDNIRILKTLMMGRIPITFNKVMYDNLHYRYPVVLIENPEYLLDYDFIREKINDAKSKYKNWDKKELTTEFWVSNIKNEINKLRNEQC
jgi:hypothetical protein